MKILMVVTSHDQLGDTGEKTGFWLEEFAAPYYVFVDGGADVTVASPKGGQPPLDPTSAQENFQTDATRRFDGDDSAKAVLANTRKLADINIDEFDAVFYPGGHGPLWDLANDESSIKLIEDAFAANKPVAAICHGPAALMKAKDGNGRPLVEGRQVAGFTNSEEEAVGLTDVVPFLIENRYKELGANYVKAEDWASFTQKDGKLITGQNPASSEAAATLLLETLRG